MKIQVDLVSTMVGCTRAKMHGFSVLQTNAYSFKAFRTLQNDFFNLLLVIAMHTNNLKMFLSQALHF